MLVPEIFNHYAQPAIFKASLGERLAKGDVDLGIFSGARLIIDMARENVRTNQLLEPQLEQVAIRSLLVINALKSTEINPEFAIDDVRLVMAGKIVDSDFELLRQIHDNSLGSNSMGREIATIQKQQISAYARKYLDEATGALKDVLPHFVSMHGAVDQTLNQNGLNVVIIDVDLNRSANSRLNCELMGLNGSRKSEESPISNPFVVVTKRVKLSEVDRIVVTSGQNGSDDQNLDSEVIALFERTRIDIASQYLLEKFGVDQAKIEAEIKRLITAYVAVGQWQQGEYWTTLGPANEERIPTALFLKLQPEIENRIVEKAFCKIKHIGPKTAAELVRERGYILETFYRDLLEGKRIDGLPTSASVATLKHAFEHKYPELVKQLHIRIEFEKKAGVGVEISERLWDWGLRSSEDFWKAWRGDSPIE